MNPRSVPDLCPKRRLRGRFLPARLAKKGRLNFLYPKTKDGSAHSPSAAEFAKFGVKSKLCSPGKGNLPKPGDLLRGETSGSLRAKCIMYPFVVLQNNKAMVAEVLKSPVFSEAFNSLIEND